MMYPVKFNRKQELDEPTRDIYELTCVDFPRHSCTITIFEDKDSIYSVRKIVTEHSARFLRYCIEQEMFAKEWVPSGVLSLPKTKDENYNFEDTVYAEVPFNIGISAQVHNKCLSVKSRFNEDKNWDKLLAFESELKTLSDAVTQAHNQLYDYVAAYKPHYRIRRV